MGETQDRELERLVAGALDWWREAGVDAVYADEPVVWQTVEEPKPQSAPGRALQRAESAPAAAQADRAPEKPTIDARSLPETLAAFTKWWLNDADLIAGPPSMRVPPRGVAGAELMVIVPEPEAEDRDTLLSGPQGRLLAAMLEAFGIGADQAYVASALPRHLPGADWEGLAQTGMGAVLNHHVALIAPKRLAIFGGSVLSLIENAPPQGPADLRIFNHDSVKVPLLAARSLAAMLEQPGWKAGVWRAWLELTG